VDLTWSIQLLTAIQPIIEKSPNTICWNEIIIIFAKDLTNPTI
jgi:hypothetical protein